MPLFGRLPECRCIKYCDKKTCENDGHEYTKASLYRPGWSLANDTIDTSVLFASPDVSPITYQTNFRTSEGTAVVVPGGAELGQDLIHIKVIDPTAWGAFIDRQVAAQANMTEEQYWEDQVAPATQELLDLISFEHTTIAVELPA